VDGLYRVVAIAGAIVVTASVLVTIVWLQGERPFSSLSVLLAGAGAGGSLAVYMLALDITLERVAVALLLTAGAVLGGFVGTKIPVYDRGGVVFAKAAGWHVAPPGLAVAAFQIAGVRESADGVILSLAAVYAATGFAVAASVLLLVRRARLSTTQPIERQAQPVTAVPVDLGLCPSCGAPLRLGAHFCKGCGAALDGS
jgi:hypothetical protein